MNSPTAASQQQQDADVDNTVEWIMFGIFFNSGQVCSATSRLIVHDSVADKVLQKLAVEAKRLFVGDPFADVKPSMVHPPLSQVHNKTLTLFIYRVL